ncbi:MAG: AMP-binding protein [Polyangiaceae bacterium]|nr:AMP-binding protein [Polyangiaceae bacterium]
MNVTAQNLVQLAERAVREFGDQPAFGTRTPRGFEWTSYRSWGRLVDECRAGLAALGVGPGDRVSVVAKNRVEWAVIAYATYGRGAALVPMYEAQRPEEWRYILNDSGAKVVFVGRSEMAVALRADLPSLPSLARVITIDASAGEDESYTTLLERGRGNSNAPEHLTSDVIAGVIYTSGTTGRPKGVLLSHENYCSNVAAIHEVFAVAGDTTLSFLPWAHAFGQTADLHAMIAAGTAIALNDEVANLIENLALVRPTLLVAVPRIFNRLYERVHQTVATKPMPIRGLFHAGLRAALRRRAGEPLSLPERLAHAGADALVFRKTRRRLGGRLRFVVSGSAALGREVAEFVEAIGVTIYEGYGLTETSPVVSANAPGRCRAGSVGRPLPGVRVEIDRTALSEERAADGPGVGEIVVYGPNVMRGYHGNPAATSERLTADGGCRTGDLGFIDEDGFLFVSGRITEQYKLENGKFVVPSPLEEDLKLSAYITNALVYGINRPHNVALVVLDLSAVQRYAGEAGVAFDDACASPEVHALITAEIEARCAGWRSYERIRNFRLINEDFTAENGLLTPSMKVRRERVVARYAAALDALYAKPG